MRRRRIVEVEDPELRNRGIKRVNGRGMKGKTNA